MNGIQELIHWSQAHFSHLPWRKKRSLYRTLVSEIMLQQTTVATVLNHFEGFVQRYPHLQSLAASTEEEVCVAWKGLGYYRRARNLLKAAQFINLNHGGKVPLTYEQLVSIPGIGDYTASALIAMGRDRPALCIDANIERVTSRLYGIRTPKGAKLAKEIKAKWQRGEIYADHHRYSYRQFNEALMDLGRSFCRANRADCPLCPMNVHCVAARGHPLSFPRSEHKKSTRLLTLDLVRCVTQKGGRVLVYQKGRQHWLAGQFELPTFILQSRDLALKQYPQWRGEDIQPLVTIKSNITKYKITNHIITLAEAKVRRLCREHQALVYKNTSQDQNLSSVTFKILKKINSLASY